MPGGVQMSIPGFGENQNQKWDFENWKCGWKRETQNQVK